MNALNRKTLRDLWQMKGQAVAIALVMACGLALFLLSRSLILSLEVTQQAYYDRYHFAEVFATLKRAPEVPEGSDRRDPRCFPRADADCHWGEPLGAGARRAGFG